MRLFLAAPLAFAAGLAMLSAPAQADGLRDHSRGAQLRDHRRSTAVRRPPPRSNRTARRSRGTRTIIKPPRSSRQTRAHQLRRSYYSNGQWTYQSQHGAELRDPLWYRYPRVAPPQASMNVLYDDTGEQVWSPGYWDWHQGSWVWMQGHWLQARRGYRWQPTRWVQHRTRGTYERYPGHWARDYRPRQRATWR